MRQVYPAEPYAPWNMGSLGRASGMLVRQYQYPDTYEERDQHAFADHDRLRDHDYAYTIDCFRRHTGTGDMGLMSWVENAEPEAVMAFLIEVMKADTTIAWTGFRILGTVHRGNGYPVWSLCLFAKHPESETQVYTEMHAPNVLPGPRDRR